MSYVEAEAPTRQQAANIAERLRCWLVCGDLQSASGAYHAWRDVNSGSLAHAYPEITGYALTWLAGRPDIRPEEERAGRGAADWLVERLGNGDRSARSGWDDSAVYNFDLGMIAAGLISFGQEVGEDTYVEQGCCTARELASLVDLKSGLEPISPQGAETTRPPSWSTQGQAHLAKCVQSLLLAGEDDAADAIATKTIGLERKGRFQTHPDDGVAMLHPHLYAVEGMWIWGSARGDSNALELARRATEWVWRHQLASGGMPRFVTLAEPAEPGPEQCDVTGQAVRMAVQTGVQAKGLKQAVERMTDLAIPGSEGCALPYSPEPGARHQNAWATMFGGQALELFATGPEAMTWRQLV